MSIKSRILLLVLLVVAASTVSLGALAFRRGSQALERSIGAALANAAVETLDKIDRELYERYEDIAHCRDRVMPPGPSREPCLEAEPHGFGPWIAARRPVMRMLRVGLQRGTD
ncbi:MAG: hypothetical protein HY303_16285, partial [Candidatus Wallbacteria bacterium]|nr:hypothetical protein [Candidatus Wallbacteria bacterium]